MRACSACVRACVHVCNEMNDGELTPTYHKTCHDLIRTGIKVYLNTEIHSPSVHVGYAKAAVL